MKWLQGKIKLQLIAPVLIVVEDAVVVVVFSSTSDKHAPNDPRYHKAYTCISEQDTDFSSDDEDAHNSNSSLEGC